MEVYTFNRLADLWLASVGTELLLLTDNITGWGSTVLDRPLLAPSLLLLLLLLPGGGELLVRCEDVAGTVVLTQWDLQMTDWTLSLGAVSEVTAGMSEIILFHLYPDNRYQL